MKINPKFYLLMVISSLFISCSNSDRSKDDSVLNLIENDKRFNTIENMAEDLISTGFTAGDGYGEVWIRDFNSFIELAVKVNGKERVSEELEMFFKFQGEDGNIPDGYIPESKASVGYKFIESELAPGFLAHKNTVETDQETSLIQAIYRYIQYSGDSEFLNRKIHHKSIIDRMEDALQYLLDFRYNQKYGLLWGATTVDWGDVQPEHEWGVELDSSSHPAIDIYDNAMFVLAINNYLELLNNPTQIVYWEGVKDKISSNIRKYLWDETKSKYKPHIYLEKGSPFPEDFNEDEIYYHGGTFTAIEAGLLSLNEIKISYKTMQQNVEKSGAPSIGLTVYPVYPEGTFENKGLGEYQYQNGGDWTWFGGRMVQQLIYHKMYDEAYEAISPMVDLVIEHDGFYEWWTRDGKPAGSGSFRGAAGVLWKAIQMFKDINEYD